MKLAIIRIIIEAPDSFDADSEKEEKVFETISDLEDIMRSQI
jgi:hypothetical protein